MVLAARPFDLGGGDHRPCLATAWRFLERLFEAPRVDPVALSQAVIPGRTPVRSGHTGAGNPHKARLHFIPDHGARPAAVVIREGDKTARFPVRGF
jgi:hypothetical protein